jgi:hypothetical protein
VDITSIGEDIDRAELQSADAVKTGIRLPDIPCTPPFPLMWLEFTGEFAVSVVREEVNGTRRVLLVHFGLSGDGIPIGPLAMYGIGLDDGGGCGDYTEEVFVGDEFSDKLFSRSFIAMHSLARMNCRNVKLEAIDGPKLVPRHQARPIPASVWHKIIISDVPKQQTTGRDASGRDEHLIRSHWVRGHYADYRKSGLFGRPQSRGIYWIPEHKRGNEELGQVIPEYAFS